MNTLTFFFLSLPVICLPVLQTTTVYSCHDVKSTLYSEAPIENIEATSVKGVSIFNTANGEIQVVIPVRSFKFKKSLMQEHFNENYMESDKYPTAKFKGKVNQTINYSQNGEYPVSVTGVLEIHGVKRQRTISGSIKIHNNIINLSSEFNVMCKDHEIEIPRIVFRNIAESIRVSVNGTYTPHTSK